MKGCLVSSVANFARRVAGVPRLLQLVSKRGSAMERMMISFKGAHYPKSGNRPVYRARPLKPLWRGHCDLCYAAVAA